MWYAFYPNYTHGDSSVGPFTTRAEAVAHAAAYPPRHGYRVEIVEAGDSPARLVNSAEVAPGRWSQASYTR